MHFTHAQYVEHFWLHVFFDNINAAGGTDYKSTLFFLSLIINLPWYHDFTNRDFFLKKRNFLRVK